MSDQIDTLYEQFNLNQTALTNSVTLATAGPNETITVRDIQINNNNGRVLDLKIGGTTIITNTGSTSYTGTEYIGPGQSLTLTYRAGTYPPAAAAAPNVYCNTFELINSIGRATYWYNDAHRNPNTVIPWSNTSTYYGTFSRQASTARNSSFPNYSQTWALWVPQSASNHYVQATSNWLHRWPGTPDSSQTLSQVTYTTAWSNNTGALMGNCAYDGSRYIYGLSNYQYNNDSDNYWGYYIKLDTFTNGIQQIPFQAENFYDFYTRSYDFNENSQSLISKKNLSYHYSNTAFNGQYLDGYYLVQPNAYQPFLLINTTTNTFRNLRFGRVTGYRGTTYDTSMSGSTYFAKSASGDYIVCQHVNDDGYSISSSPRYYTFDWWNIGPDLSKPQVRNSGTFRQRHDDGYNYIHFQQQATRDPNNPSYYYVISGNTFNNYTYDINTATNSNYLTIVDFTFGYPVMRYIRSMNSAGISSHVNQNWNGGGYLIPSLTNYTYTAPATPAFGTVDVRVAGIRSSI